MKIIHTSDWHLGARLHEQERLPEQKQFLDWLLGLLRTERPDALLVSGDVFDTRTPSNEALQSLYDFYRAVRGEKLCPAIVVTAGNHDSAAVLQAPRGVLGLIGIHVVAEPDREHPEALAIVIPGADGGPGLAIGAVPFLSDADCFNVSALPLSAERADRIRDGFRSYFRGVFDACMAKGGGCPVVLMGHCALQGAKFSDDRSERGRFSQVGGLDALGADFLPSADYVALGHLHLPQGVGGEEPRIVYSGSPIAMSFDEGGRGGKSVVVAEFGVRHGEPVAVRRVEVPVFRPLVTLECTPEVVRKGVSALVQKGRPAFVRICVTQYAGELALFWQEVDTLVKDTEVRVLEKSRPQGALPADGGLQALRAEGTLRDLSPRDIARRRLEAASCSPDEMARYLAMLSPIFQESL